MPLVFTKTEIKRHLAELGFEEISDEQLALFIKDLKKLIKHEEKKRHERRVEEKEYPTTPSTYSTERVSSLSLSSPGADVVNVDVPSSAGSQKENSKKQKEIQKSHERKTKGKENQSPIVQAQAPPSLSNPGLSCEPTSSTLSTFCKSESDTSSVDESQRRTKLPPKSVRHDPVALYHFYKSIWDKQKSPGEDPRMKLRWNVRAGTLGRVPCDPSGTRVKYLR